MSTSNHEDPRLVRLSEICAALPESDRERRGAHAVFRVRRKTFAYYQDDHHGDGMVSVVCKAHPGENESLIASDPERFHMPAYVGRRGWVGVRLDIGEIDWEDLAELVTESYALTAPKRLAAQVGGSD